MKSLLEEAKEILSDNQFSIGENSELPLLLTFEGPSVLGFLIEFDSTETLIETWQEKLQEAQSRYQLALRSSGEKAWNAYAIMLTQDNATSDQKVVLQSIEENLTGTRKIVRAEINGKQELIQALLPLLPIQSHPKLPPIDIVDEIRKRTTELPEDALDALFSNASDVIALQVIEEAQ